MMCSQERLKELFTYNPITGLFVRKTTFGGRMAGEVSGCIDSDGYIRISIDGKSKKAHRLAWLYEYGYTPKFIDHINHDRTDNRIENLREIKNKSENSKNKKQYKNNTTGTTGVYWDKAQKRWRALIKVELKNIHLGRFENYSDALNARKNAEILYGFHENHGKVDL